jgi:hypothetical protein
MEKNAAFHCGSVAAEPLFWQLAQALLQFVRRTSSAGELVEGSLSRYGKLGDQEGVDLPCPRAMTIIEESAIAAAAMIRESGLPRERHGTPVATGTPAAP